MSGKLEEMKTAITTLVTLIRDPEFVELVNQDRIGHGFLLFADASLCPQFLQDEAESLKPKDRPEPALALVGGSCGDQLLLMKAHDAMHTELASLVDPKAMKEFMALQALERLLESLTKKEAS
jgi:hypothetical protein